MQVEQYVMAYGAEQDRLRALMPRGFVSLRPVLRINAEIVSGVAALEYNTAVSHDGLCGWLNIGAWQGIPFQREGGAVCFLVPGLTVVFTRIGISGGCPAERDNCGCWFLPAGELRPSEEILAAKEFCDCRFAFDGGAHGESIGKTLPALPTPPRVLYPPVAFTVQNAAAIPCEQVLGSYSVTFERNVT